MGECMLYFVQYWACLHLSVQNVWGGSLFFWTHCTYVFDFDHITAVDMSFCTSLQNFIEIGPPSAEKNDVMSIFKMADLSHLGF